MADLSNIVSKVSSVWSEHVKPGDAPGVVMVDASHIREVCEFLQRDPDCYFDMLSCLTGLDNGPEAGTMEVIYNLYSIPFHLHLMLRVIVRRDNPEVPSVTSVYRTANWHEREAYDLFGIRFTGHPDLRRILLPADWEGYPLRKDYRHQEYYRGVKVEY
jgi:NADH-quinone oxidoreductase subunit C